MDYDGKVVLITGAGSGIGMAAAVMFAREGARVVACDIKQSGLENTEHIVKAGVNSGIDTMIVDVKDSALVKNVVEKTVKKHGNIDILVNSAGIIHLGVIEDISDDQWNKVLDANLKGTFIFCRETIPVLKQQGKGCIINITAAAAKTGGMNVGGNYVASKGGISALTIHLAKQLAPFGIRVNAISPGPIETPMLVGDTGGGVYSMEMKENLKNSTPLGMGTPEDIAHGILFLASDTRARFITGEILDIDGGLFMD